MPEPDNCVSSESRRKMKCKCFKWFLIGFIVGLMCACEPVDFTNYNIIQGYYYDKSSDN